MRRSLTTLLAASGTDSPARQRLQRKSRQPPGLPAASSHVAMREAELEDERGGRGGSGAGRGSTCLWSQLLGRLRLEDRLSPGVLGCSALCRSGIHTKFGINRVTSREQGATRPPKEAMAGAPGGETEDMDFLSGLELADLLDPRQPDWPLEPGLGSPWAGSD